MDAQAKIARYERSVHPVLGKALAQAISDPACDDPILYIGRFLIEHAGVGDHTAADVVSPPQHVWRERAAPLRAAPVHRGQSPEPPGCIGRVARLASRAKQPPAPREPGEPEWQAKDWLSAEGCSKKLAELLLEPLHDHLERDGPMRDGENMELELIRALWSEQQATDGGCQAAVLALLQHSDGLSELATFIANKVGASAPVSGAAAADPQSLPPPAADHHPATPRPPRDLPPPALRRRCAQIEKLVEAVAVSGEALNTKFVEEFSGKEMAFGQPKEFFKGLDGLIGPPNPNLQEGMRWEHCERKDSHRPFKTPNSGITTTASIEFLYVVEPSMLTEQPEGSSARRTLPSDMKDPGDGDQFLRHPKPPAEFAAKLAAKNEQLEELDLPGLILEEFHAARLYTGPMVSSRATRGCGCLVAAPVG